MKLTGSIVDCVYESNSYRQEIKQKLVDLLPDRRICEIASILVIATNCDKYIVKIRMCETKEDGSIDVEKIHQRVMESEFIEISKDDYKEVSKNDFDSVRKRTNELIKLGANVIFKMDIDDNELNKSSVF